MPNLKPIAELHNNYDEIYEFCQQSGQPIYLTKNGAVDLVVLSRKAYDSLTKKI